MKPRRDPTLYQQARATAAPDGSVSIALIQRALACGYAKAAKLAQQIRRRA